MFPCGELISGHHICVLDRSSGECGVKQQHTPGFGHPEKPVRGVHLHHSDHIIQLHFFHNRHCFVYVNCAIVHIYNDSAIPYNTTDLPSVFTIGEQTVYIRQGLPVTLSYSFVGLPVPNVTWSGPSGQQIQSNSQFTVRTSSNFTQLTINSLNGSDTGNYTCIASNYLGLSSLSTAVYVQGKDRLLFS